MPIEENFFGGHYFFAVFLKNGSPKAPPNLRIPKEVPGMTQEEKIRVRELRQNGISYSNISQATGLSLNTIKSFCLRNGMTSSKREEGPTCLNCGKRLRKSHFKPRKFCSDGCRNMWWNKRRYLRHSEKMKEYICPVCGERFYDYSSKNRKYCSQSCYQNRRLEDERT